MSALVSSVHRGQLTVCKTHGWLRRGGEEEAEEPRVSARFKNTDEI